MASLSANGDFGLLTVFGHLGEQAVTVCADESGGHILICDPDGQVQADLNVADPPEAPSEDARRAFPWTPPEAAGLMSGMESPAAPAVLAAAPATPAPVARAETPTPTGP